MGLSGKRLSKRLEANVDEIKQRLGSSDDLIVKSMTGLQGWHGVLVYIDGLTDSTIIHHSILDFLMSENQASARDSVMTGSDTLHYIKETVLAAGEVTIIEDYDKIFGPIRL